ncbi:hypothetical protein L7F22_019499 [Adiantum nelumboides]|nr:hypothetical protein [Adiantum nelumboides]
MTTQNSTISTARRWWHRGSADHGWLKTFHTFSFASYYNPQWMTFGCLRVVNEDRVAAKTGFPTHPHNNAEIFSYIINGKLTHKDSMGNVETLQRGEVQFTSAGSGIRHSEYNDHPKDECHFLQIWYTPRQRNLTPKYYTLPQVKDEEKTNKLMTLIRDVDTFTQEEREKIGLLPVGRAIPAHCSLTTRTSILTPGNTVKHILGHESKQSAGERWSFIHLAMTSGYKDPEVLKKQVQKDIAGYSQHKERLQHAARYCKSVYDVEPNVINEGKAKKLKATDAEKARVTLTYAQSRDGKIAGENKKMLALSNAESMTMTHSLRILHDGILVGVNTLINDNPQLNARLLNPLIDGKDVPLDALPRPIVIDSKLRTPLDCKLLNNARQGTGKRPLIITSSNAEEAKVKALHEAGAEVIKVTTDSNGHLSWPDLLTTLRQEHQIESVMVEGGATVIESLLSAHAKQPLINELIVTVAPNNVGEKGLSYKAPKWVTDQTLPKDNNKNSLANTNSLAPLQSEPQIFQSDVILTWSQGMKEKNEAQIRVGDQLLSEGDGVFLRGGQVGEEIEITNVGGRNAEL